MSFVRSFRSRWRLGYIRGIFCQKCCWHLGRRDRDWIISIHGVASPKVIGDQGKYSSDMDSWWGTHQLSVVVTFMCCCCCCAKLRQWKYWWHFFGKYVGDSDRHPTRIGHLGWRDRDWIVSIHGVASPKVIGGQGKYSSDIDSWWGTRQLSVVVTIMCCCCYCYRSKLCQWKYWGHFFGKYVLDRERPVLLALATLVNVTQIGSFLFVELRCPRWLVT